ncbi:MAG: hypothetical protein FRX48_06932 [Lasallia pustulata]|uniref:N-acetyltransferase domain-containing protein n=1 Tax=Lasallia pustulata TaxID=136370 RepID=A0A5M8PIY6_9LECA|nr:MAG: hypothetical protein FRX48_06932 [Lasallia pustulata]
MLINRNTAISTPKVLLVPYCKHHVPTYHEWMQDEDLQKATASERLTLPDEHSMQQTWRRDTDKLTFITCTLPSVVPDAILATTHDSFDCMLGDVNLFLTDHHDADPSGVVAEIELMIARKRHQGHGYGRASLLAFLTYVIKHEREILREYSRGNASRVEWSAGTPVRFEYFVVKIDQANQRSVGLFESVGFVKVGEANYFGEVELRCEQPAGWSMDADGEYRELRYEGGD